MAGNTQPLSQGAIRQSEDQQMDTDADQNRNRVAEGND